MDLPVAGTVILGTLVAMFVDFLRYVTSGTWKPALTQLVAWVSGIGAVFLVSASDFGNTVVNGIRLDDADGPTKLLLGLLASSLVMTVIKGYKAIDNTQSAAVPPLGGTPPG